MVVRRLEGLIALGIVLVIMGSFAGAAEPFDQEYKLLAKVLGKYVSKGRVNYAGLTLDHAGLDEFVSRAQDLGKNDYEAFTMDQKRAYWINAYNAFVLKTVVDHYPIKASSGFSKYPDPSPLNIEGAWNENRFKSPLGKVTLNRIENDILPGLGQPFYIFAVSNGTKGAPGLQGAPYLGIGLTAQLEAAASRFARDPERIAIDAASSTVTITKYLELYGPKLIPKYFTADLYKNRDKLEVALMNFLIQYGDQKNAPFIRADRFTLNWKPLDWTLNDIL